MHKFNGKPVLVVEKIEAMIPEVMKIRDTEHWRDQLPTVIAELVYSLFRPETVEQKLLWVFFFFLVLKYVFFFAFYLYIMNRIPAAQICDCHCHQRMSGLRPRTCVLNISMDMSVLAQCQEHACVSLPCIHAVPTAKNLHGTWDTPMDLSRLVHNLWLGWNVLYSLLSCM